ncbi:hypothetical protein CHS0354_042493, partial [Potamilus streckersoni]
IIVILVNEITGQGNCNSFGYSSLSGVTTYLGPGTGRAYISQYQLVGCTGTVSAWQFYARHYGTIYFQIWRRSGSTLNFMLVGQNAITITEGTSFQEQDIIINVPPDMRISAQPGDYIGWMTSGTEMITYGSDSTVVYYMSTTSVAIGTTYSFTSSINRNYPVKVYMDN